jgi:hypothetical protein
MVVEEKKIVLYRKEVNRNEKENLLFDCDG